jgi:hypothetical protein
MLARGEGLVHRLVSFRLQDHQMNQDMSKHLDMRASEADDFLDRCVRASLFGSFGQLDGDASAISADDPVLIEYTRSNDTLSWSQYVSNAVTGEYYSNFTHDSGSMTGWGTGTECDDSCNGTIAAQTYWNTTITLESADSSFGDTLVVSGGVTYEGFTSLEDGRIWFISQINVPAMESS